jgi:hypothetical protein
MWTTLIIFILLAALGCDTNSAPPGAKYKMTVYSQDGKEVKELTRYGSSLRYTAAGPMMVDAKTGLMFSLPYVPEGTHVEVIDLKTDKVVHRYWIRRLIL